jgi:hypothetical protein
VLVCAWIWVNTHGSFPLGLVAVAALALGGRLDGERTDREVSVLRWAAAGTLLGAVNPLGPRLLVFPVELLRRQDVLRNVLEWRSPGFVDLWDRSFVVLLVVAVLTLVRRPSWRAALPMLVFSVAALLGARNVVFATIVLVATAAPALAGLGSLRWSIAVPRGRAVMAAVGALLLLVMVTRLQRVDDFVLTPRFPVGALAVLEQRDVDLTEVRLVTHDYVGNFLTAVYPDGRRVYFDDRFDMYPAERVDGYLGLLNGNPGWSAELDRVDADIVIWRRDAPLSQILTADPRWSTMFAGDGFATFCRRGSEVADLGC